MTQADPIQLPTDTPPRLGVAIAVALLGFALGIAITWSLRPRPSRPQPVAVAPQRDQVARPEDQRARDAAADIQIADATQAEAETAVTTAQTPRTTTPAVDTTASEATVPQRSDGRAPYAAATASGQVAPKGEQPEVTLIPGRVAYLRCDGLSADRGRFPCPRDAALEQEVWNVLALLPKCQPSLGRGGVDVRLDFNRGQRTEARVLAIAGSPEPPLDKTRVYSCVGDRLARIATTLDPIYMMVSFRAVLR